MLLKISQISQENTCVGAFFNKVVGLQACNFIKNRLDHRCFYVKFAKFLRTYPAAASINSINGVFIVIREYEKRKLIKEMMEL